MHGKNHANQITPVQQQKVAKTTDKGIPIDYPQYAGELENLASVAYEKRLYIPLLETVMLEFGVGRRAFFRSEEVNKFRQVLKDTARAKSYDDIDNLVGSSTANDSILMKFTKSNLAKKDAYKESKLSVDSVMKQEAEKVISKVAEKVQTTTDLVKYSIPKIDQTKPTEKVTKQFASVVDKEAKQLEPDVKKEAIVEAKKLVQQVVKDEEKGDLKDKLNLDKGSSSKDLLVNVRDQAEKQEIGKKSFTKFETINETSIYSAFSKIASAVRQIVPNVGDTAEAQFEINIPIAPAASFVINIGASCEHDVEEIEQQNGTSAPTTSNQEYYSVGAEVNIGAAGGISALMAKATLKGTVGMFLEATGKKAEEALTLLSYGMYRVMYTKAPKLAASIWGNGEKSGFSNFEEAEMWALMVEKNMLNDEHSKVSVGLQAGLSAEAETTKKYKKLASYSGEGELKGQKFYEYSKKILGDAQIESPEQFENLLEQVNDDDRLRKLQSNPSSTGSSNDRKQLEQLLLDKKTKFKDNIHHKSKVSLSASTDFTFGKKAGFGVSIEGSLLFNHSGDKVDLKHRSAKLETIELGISISFPEAIDNTGAFDHVFNQSLPKVSDFASTIIGNTINKSMDSKNEDEVAYREMSLTYVNTVLQSTFSELNLEDTAFEEFMGSSITAGLSIELDMIDGDHSVDFELTRNQSFEVDFEVVSGSIEKSKRLFKKSLLG